jgi:hypothetical protein
MGYFLKIELFYCQTAPNIFHQAARIFTSDLSKNHDLQGLVIYFQRCCNPKNRKYSALFNKILILSSQCTTRIIVFKLFADR